MKLNLGCGAQVVDGWVNVDYAIGAQLTKIPLFSLLNRKLKLFDLNWHPKIYIHDLTTRFPWTDNSISAIYSSHTLEHFTREDGRRFLQECHRVLCPEAPIRIIVPDLQSFVNQYTNGFLPADEFIEKLGVLYEGSQNSLKKRLYPFIQFPHKCMYDAPRLLEIMQEVGFDVACKAPFESTLEDIAMIEIAERTESAVIVEGRKRTTMAG